MELAELVERSRAPRSEIRLIVVLGRRQVGKTSVVLEHFMKKTNVYCHEEARAMQLGSDRKQACGQKHLGKQELQHIVGKVYEKSRQNITIIFDIPHNAEDADVTRVYEDLKGMVYDDTTHRRPVLGIIILSNHYQVDAFPRDKGRFRTLWVGDLEESEATEYVGKLQADGSVMTDMGTGLKELAWARDLHRWKQEVEYSVRHARTDPQAEELMAMIAEEGAAGLSMTRLLNLREKLSFSLRDVFHIVRPFSEVFYFDRKRDAFLFVSPHHRVRDLAAAFFASSVFGAREAGRVLAGVRVRETGINRAESWWLRQYALDPPPEQLLTVTSLYALRTHLDAHLRMQLGFFIKVKFDMEVFLPGRWEPEDAPGPF
eukprot:s1721_g16.t1